MTNKMTVIILAAIVTGCSSPPPPVPVEWDKAAAPLNTRLPQWRDNNVIVFPRQLTVNGHHQSAHKVSTIQHGRQPYFMQSLIQHELSSLRNPVLISLMPGTGFARMAQKASLNTSLFLIA
ncbi:hypothetical protein HmCmsJML134_04324 [Escherichia coli]|nr:hypothetical protein HmCmsJML134_04324 [Escherichia coli]